MATTTPSTWTARPTPTPPGIIRPPKTRPSTSRATSRSGKASRSAVDRRATYLARAVELAARAVRRAAPNPPVGAVIVRDGRTLGEGYHHRRVSRTPKPWRLRAARDAGAHVRGATAVRFARTARSPSTCRRSASAIAAASSGWSSVRSTRTRRTRAATAWSGMRAAGVAVDVHDRPRRAALIERFPFTLPPPLPYVTLKMAMSLDGAFAPQPGRAGVSLRERRRARRPRSARRTRRRHGRRRHGPHRRPAPDGPSASAPRDKPYRARRGL